MLDDIFVMSMLRHFLSKAVPYEMVGEAFILTFVDVFKRYSGMTTARLDLGVKILKRAAKY